MLRVFRGASGYGELVERLRRGVESGELARGTRLPSHRRLAYDLDVAIGTVTRAYQIAEREGLIVSYSAAEVSSPLPGPGFAASGIRKTRTRKSTCLWMSRLRL